jgi:hypothetical protein
MSNDCNFYRQVKLRNRIDYRYYTIAAIVFAGLCAFGAVNTLFHVFKRFEA